MSRDLFINGETLVTVRGSAGSAIIGSLQELGLAAGPIRITPSFNHMAVNADAWGQAPFEMQFMLAHVNLSMTLVHFDRVVLAGCLAESMGGGAAEGTLTRAGTRLGSNAALYSASNHYISVGLTSPVAGSPWRFFTGFMTGPPIEYPLGTERSLVVVNFMIIPATADPYNAGLGATGTVLFDHGTLQ